MVACSIVSREAAAENLQRSDPAWPESELTVRQGRRYERLMVLARLRLPSAGLLLNHGFCVVVTSTFRHRTGVFDVVLSLRMTASHTPPSSPIDPAVGFLLQRERSLAMLTVRFRPSTLCPLRALIAVWAVSEVAISTKPKPRDLPVSRSLTTWALVTSPCWAKSVWRSFELVLNESSLRRYCWTWLCSFRSVDPLGPTAPLDLSSVPGA